MSEFPLITNPGHWTKGVSGNPLGRPRGARNRTTMASEALLEGEAEALTRKAIDAALAGDPWALRLCLERILPASRARPVTLDLSSGQGAEGVAAAMDETVRAMGAGEITPEEAMTVSGVLEAQRRTVETVDLDRRIATLEATAAREDWAEQRRLAAQAGRGPSPGFAPGFERNGRR
jgi:hypothetical protein